jgi:hypothetical protein
MCSSKTAVVDEEADTGSTAANDGAIDMQGPHVAQEAHLPD